MGNDISEGATPAATMVEGPSNPVNIRGGSTATAKATQSGGGLDIGLMVYFALWYLGNYYVSAD